MATQDIVRNKQKFEELNKRFDSLRNHYTNNWKPAHQDLSTYIDPTRGIFDNNRSVIGKKINHKVLLDSHATYAKRVTASGMQTGMTDPSRPWFKLNLDNVLLEEVPGVRAWMDEVTNRMIDVMLKSNIYRVFQNCYDELVQFGVGCFLILEDFDDVVRGRSFTAGEYYLGVDNKGRVNQFGRDFEMTVAQMIQEFGIENCSPTVQAFSKNNQGDAVVKIRHLIEENKDRDLRLIDGKNMPYRSVYWEYNVGNDRFLDYRGMKRFPVVAPRWDVPTTNMSYGYGPGWHALGDIKELQITHQDMLLAQEKAHNPPTVEDASVVGHVNRLPGGNTKTSGNVPNSGLRAAYQVDSNLAEFRDSIQVLHDKISRHLFADVFLMISNMDRSTITAFEVAKREQEKMMMLGPILHGLNEEMHDVSIDLIFDIMLDASLIPDPPQEIFGQELKVQYVSVLAQAQKAIGVEQINNTLVTIANWGAVYPGATDNINIDEAVRNVTDMSGIPSKITKDKGQMAQERQERVEQQNKQIALEAANSAADTTEKLGNAKVNDSNMLDVISQAAGNR